MEWQLINTQEETNTTDSIYHRIVLPLCIVNNIPTEKLPKPKSADDPAYGRWLNDFLARYNEGLR